jgi:hypothetical protein
MSTPPQEATETGKEPFLPPVGAVEVAKPVTETRPEILVGAAFAGGLVLAKLVGRIRGR